MSSYFNQGNILPSALVGTGVGLATHSAGWGLLGAAATPLVMDTFSGRRREYNSLFGGGAPSTLGGGRRRRSRRSRSKKMIRKGSKVSQKGIHGEVVKVMKRSGRKTQAVSLPSKRRTMMVKSSELNVM